MKNRAALRVVIVLIVLVVAGGVAWESRRREEERKAREVAEMARAKEARIEACVAIARQVIEEVPLFDFWPQYEDLGQVQQITVAHKLKRSHAQLGADLAAGLIEITTDMPATGPPAWLRQEQAGDVSFALLHPGAADPYYRQAVTLAAAEYNEKEALRLSEKVANALHAAKRYEQERQQREKIARHYGGFLPPDPRPFLTATHEALCLWGLGRPQDALARLDAAFQPAPPPLDAQHPDLLMAMVARAALYSHLKQPDASAAEVARMLAECERVYGPDDIHLALPSVRLLGIRDETGHPWSELKPLGLRALALCDKYYGPDYPVTTLALHAMAIPLERVGEYQACEDALQRSLEAEEKYLPPDSLPIANELYHLGQLANRLNRMADGQRFFRGALDIFEKVLGPKVPRTESCRRDLATLNGLMDGNREGAETVFRQTLSDEEKDPSGDPREICRTLTALGMRQTVAGQFQAAESTLRRAVAMAEHLDLHDNRELMRALQSLGVCLLEAQRFADAEPLFARALAMEEKVLGPEHPDLVATLSHYAQAIMGEGRPTEAERLLRRAISISVASGTSKDIDMHTTLSALAKLYQESHRLDEALVLYRQAVANLEISVGTQNGGYAQALANMGVVLEELQRTDEAEHALEQAIAIGEKLPPEEREFSLWLSNLAVIRYRHREKTSAEPLFRRALAIGVRQSKEAGKPVPNLQIILASYGNFLKDFGLTHEQIMNRVSRVLHAEEVSALPTPGASLLPAR